MVTKEELQGLPEDADLRRADSLAREIFSDVANKWALLIVEALGDRTLRFGELRNEVEGISHKMLTQNLRMLERNGLVDRKVYPTVPPRVEYTLTEPGRALRGTVDGICDWTHRYLGRIEEARRRADS
ncbi:winged helix-turn-helix transcriptional regulator [Streptomyces sp. NPDC094448]|uniref:winged helix-turn-helix transcriptional regulator n=1 Tax=Streptomyces sp. NPDC094448 TaxID=3366063 RepID=UPI00382AB175